MKTRKKIFYTLLFVLSTLCLTFAIGGCKFFSNKCGHDKSYLKRVFAQAPTCTESGWDDYQICTYDGCDYSTYKEIPALGHSFVSYEAKEPTCTEIGWKAYEVCERCSLSNYVELAIDEDNHDLVQCEGKAPTYEDYGWADYEYCQRDNCYYSTYVKLPQLKHNLVSYPKKEPTCTEVGWYQYYKCTGCATENCDYSTYVEIPATGHTETVAKAVAPTCTQTGLTEGTRCSVCKASIIKQEIIPANGHEFSDGTCNNCSALDPDYSASIGLKYELSSDSAYYKVSGIGSCKNLDIVIADTYKNLPVLSIASSAFKDCNGLTSVNIPKSVTAIGYEAFYNCTGLTSITIPESVTQIGERAFYGCFNLKSVTIGNSVKTIGKQAFHDCYNLLSLTIPASVTTINENAFSGCYRLVEVYNKSNLTITKGNRSFGDVAYYAKDVYTAPYTSKLSTDENGYVTHTNGDSVSLIAYFGTAQDAIIPNGVTEINQHAFYKNTVIKSLTLSSSVTSIGNGSFSSCSNLQSATISASVKLIGINAFSTCDKLSSVTFENPNAWQRYTSLSSQSSSSISNLNDPETAAKYLRTTYDDYYWKR